MAHLSIKHESANRRRHEILRERALLLSDRASYREESLSSSRRITVSKKTSMTNAMEDISIDSNKYMEGEIAAAHSRCQNRLKSARDKSAAERRRIRDDEQERQAHNQHLSAEAAAAAAQRLRDRKDRERHTREDEIALLISQQSSSIKAMNIARMLSPRFQERAVLAPVVPKNSVEEQRIQHLLTSTHIGSFYK